MAEDRSFDRRDFLRQAGAVGAVLGAAGSALARSSSRTGGRVIGANDRINVGVIGVGGRGHYVGMEFAKIGKDKNSCQVLAVADCYQKRINKAKQDLKCDDGYLDYREIINRKDIDAQNRIYIPHRVIVKNPGSAAIGDSETLDVEDFFPKIKKLREEIK